MHIFHPGMPVPCGALPEKHPCPVRRGAGQTYLSQGPVFNPQEGTWGAFCLAVRKEHFHGDPDWINPASHVSVETADAYSLALNWVLYPYGPHYS